MRQVYGILGLLLYTSKMASDVRTVFTEIESNPGDRSQLKSVVCSPCKLLDAGSHKEGETNAHAETHQPRE